MKHTILAFSAMCALVGCQGGDIDADPQVGVGDEDVVVSESALSVSDASRITFHYSHPESVGDIFSCQEDPSKPRYGHCEGRTVALEATYTGDIRGVDPTAGLTYACENFCEKKITYVETGAFFPAQLKGVGAARIRRIGQGVLNFGADGSVSGSGLWQMTGRTTGGTAVLGAGTYTFIFDNNTQRYEKDAKGVVKL